jgi:hypothetical protein
MRAATLGFLADREPSFLFLEVSMEYLLSNFIIYHVRLEYLTFDQKIPHSLHNKSFDLISLSGTRQHEVTRPT